DALRKKMLILLSSPARLGGDACEGRAGEHEASVPFLRESGIPFVNGLERHRGDFRSFATSPKESADRYYIGHYKPQGNHFFAFAVKDAFVGWLDPAPLAYRGAEVSFATVAARLAV